MKPALARRAAEAMPPAPAPAWSVSGAELRGDESLRTDNDGSLLLAHAACCCTAVRVSWEERITCELHFVGVSFVDDMNASAGGRSTGREE